MIWIILTVITLVFGLVVFRGAPYVPSHKKSIHQAFTDLYPLSAADYLVDIGSGDGVVLRMASKFGAQTVGYEINPILVLISRFLSRKDSYVSVRLADFWLTNLPDKTTVVYVFSVTRDMDKIAKRLQSQADKLGRAISLIVYGSKINGIKSVKSVGAYNLYEFHSLQPGKPQV